MTADLKVVADTNEARLDPIIDDETRRGFRVKAVPEAMQAQLKDAEVNPFTFVRMTRLNPARRRKITEVVQRAYHKDLKDVDLLSTEQVLKLVAERGEWTPAIESRMTELKERTTVELASLYHEGVARSKDWIVLLESQMASFLTAVDTSEHPADTKLEIARRFARWQQYRPDRQALYVDRYAAELNGGLYYPDSDLAWLMDKAPSLDAAAALEDVAELTEKIQRYVTLVNEREEYETLRMKRLRIFANTVESRRDNAEEMARTYFTTERCDAEGMPAGPLAMSFEGLYDFPDESIQWLVEEQFFFHSGIPDEVREYVGAFGFQPADPTATESAPQPPISASPGSAEPSDASPEVPKPSTDSPALEATPSSTTVSLTLSS